MTGALVIALGAVGTLRAAITYSALRMIDPHQAAGPRVLSLERWSMADRARLGGKATGLVLLRESGCTVPDAFAVTAEAFREHLARAVPDEDLVAFAALEERRRATALASIREGILAAPIDRDLAREIEAAFRALPGGPVAVRSSGTSEDAAESAFAGLHDTRLNVIDAAACLDAIRSCWASMFTDRAVAYRERRGIDSASGAMAVIVQTLAAAQVSGIAFSADPVSGLDDRVVIESSWGLGEAIVSGRVTPDRFVVSKRDGTIIESVIGDKLVECVPDCNGGTVERSVEPERARRPSLDEDDVRRLARSVLEVERRAGAAQDVEFARTDSGFVFLQARPVTTIAPRRGDRQVWSNLNAAEVLPDVVSPMTWSVISSLEVTGRRKLQRIGVEIGDAPMLGLVAGRVYFNVTTLAAIGRRVPFGRLIDIDRVLGGAGAQASGRPPELSLRDLPPVRIRWLRMLSSLPGQVVSIVRRHPGGATRRVEALAERRRAVEAHDLHALPASDLLATFEATVDALFGDEDLLVGPAVGMMYFLALGWICRARLDDGDGAIANGLLGGQGGIASAESGRDLWRLAAWAHAREAVADVVREARPFEETRAMLEASEDGRELLRRWDRFLAEHGHHTRGELELLNPRWREQPDYVLGLMRGYLAAADEIDPIAAGEALARQSAMLADRCRRDLFPPWRPVFGIVLRQARAGAVLRENLKNEAVRFVALLRTLLLEVGTKMQGAGALDDRDDVFFLDRAELARVVGDGADLRQVIAGRRAEHRRNQEGVPPPPVVVGVFDHAGARSSPPQPAATTGTILRGIAVSPGRAIGPARVILRATEDEHLRPGEILVAPFTDPGWTPYFVTAAGIVMDIGGLLSHGSIVAREYGIPAVVNVGHATTTIKTGQMIEVDGSGGVVRVLEERVPQCVS